MEITKIERFFLNTLLRVVIAGVSLILASDFILYPEDQLSVVIDIVILLACITSYLIRNRFHTLSVLIFTSIVLSAMFYQALVVPVNTTTSLSVILVVGFIHSVMLKGKPMWIMHALTYTAILTIFLIQFQNPQLRFSDKMNDIVTVAITYSILYFILTYATGILKASYDRIHGALKEMNFDLQEKNNEIAAQNEELLQIQDNLNELNTDLEGLVNERTEKVQIQNDILLKYSYRNAHDLRGPVARLLGLASLVKLESPPEHDFIMEKMVEQAHEIDHVVKQINVELTVAESVVHQN
jgi:signal transduction histidine kinase